MRNYSIPVLTIAGSDSSGGAGIQADLKTFSALGTYGMSVITAITAQNTVEVADGFDLSEDIIKKQIEVVYEDIPPRAIKVGMVSSEKIIKAISEEIRKYKPEYLVIDPVMISKSGYSLLKKEAKTALIKELIPLGYIVTPNLPEAEEITGMKIETLDDMKKAGEKILSLGCKYVLVKGGHLEGDAVDILMGENLFRTYLAERVNTKNTHGTGCTLSSAIAANLALGHNIESSVELSKNYITNAIKNSHNIGHGSGPVNHFYEFEK